MICYQFEFNQKFMEILNVICWICCCCCSILFWYMILIYDMILLFNIIICCWICCHMILIYGFDIFCANMPPAETVQSVDSVRSRKATTIFQQPEWTLDPLAANVLVGVLDYSWTYSGVGKCPNFSHHPTKKGIFHLQQIWLLWWHETNPQ